MLLKKELYLSALILTTSAFGSQDKVHNHNWFNKDKIYIGLSGAYSWYPTYKPVPRGGTIEPIGRDVIKDGYAVGGMVGYQFHDYVRGDLEFTYRKHIFDKFELIRDFPARGFKNGQVLPLGKDFGSVYSYSYMTNIYFDWKNSTKFTPFIGVGAGVVHYVEDNSCGFDYVNAPGYQFMGGVQYKFSDKYRIEAAYKYFEMRDSKITNNCLSPKIKYQTNELMISAKMYLN